MFVRKQGMSVAVWDEQRVTATQRERRATLHAQQRGAMAHKVELRFAGCLMERHAKGSAGFNTAIFHTGKAHST